LHYATGSSPPKWEYISSVMIEVFSYSLKATIEFQEELDAQLKRSNAG
jgi:hypothetical protein